MDIKPTVSVILPFFNAKKSIEKAIHSIINQRFSSLELIVVDNNSSDSSSKIAKELAGSDSRIRFTEESKQGVCYAFDTGYAHAGGRYIARMDADAFILVYQPQVEIREEIASFLNEREYVEGKDYLFVS